MTPSTTTANRVYTHLRTVRMLAAATEVAAKAYSWKNTEAFCLSIVVGLPKELRAMPINWAYLHDRLVLNAESYKCGQCGSPYVPCDCGTDN